MADSPALALQPHGDELVSKFITILHFFSFIAVSCCNLICVIINLW